MSHDLGTRAELVKLGRLLGVEPDVVAFLEQQGADDIHALREGISAAF